MADELAKKISELDTLPGGNLNGFFTIGTKDNASGVPTSYKVNLGVLMIALADAASAVADAGNAVDAANAAKAAFLGAIVQASGQNIDKVMSQKAVTDLVATVNTALTALTGQVGDIIDLIPAAADITNQLADKNFVNSSINNLTAKLITNNGEPFSSLAQLQQVTGANNNDYAYVAVTEQGAQYYDRYKYNGIVWELEYRVNSTVYTAAQWNAINSGITALLVTKLRGLPDEYNSITTSEINDICN